MLRPRWAARTRLLPRTHSSRGRKFAWADEESGMQTRHDPLPCGVSALLLNPDRPKQKARLRGVFRAPQKRQTRFSKPSTGPLNLIWSLNRIDRGRKKPGYAMIQPAHTGLKHSGVLRNHYPWTWQTPFPPRAFLSLGAVPSYARPRKSCY